MLIKGIFSHYNLMLLCANVLICRIADDEDGIKIER
jgi:hypothetical protein